MSVCVSPDLPSKWYSLAFKWGRVAIQWRPYCSIQTETGFGTLCATPLCPTPEDVRHSVHCLQAHPQHQGQLDCSRGDLTASWVGEGIKECWIYPGNIIGMGHLQLFASTSERGRELGEMHCLFFAIWDHLGPWALEEPIDPCTIHRSITWSVIRRKRREIASMEASFHVEL